MTKNRKTYPLPPVFQQWVQYAMDYGTPQDVVNVVIQQQQALQRVEALTFNGKTEGAEYAFHQTYKRWEAEQGIDEFGNKPSDYTNTGSVNDTNYALSIGWKPPSV